MNNQLMNYVANQLGISIKQVEHTLQLLAEGNTVPFIARYRKEATLGLDEDQIRGVEQHYDYQQQLLKRKEDVKRLIAVQDKLTVELEQEINNAVKLFELEDLYRPYQQKRKTRASNAINAGLKPLADEILQFPLFFDEKIMENYISEQYATIEAVLQGVKDIIAEMISDSKQYRDITRREITKFGKIVSKLKKDAVDEGKIFQLYYERSEPVRFVAEHRIMAMNRGESEKILTISFDYNKDLIEEKVAQNFIKHKQSTVVEIVKEAIYDGLNRLLFPSVEREIRNELSEKAHNKSMDVFSLNLEKLLLQAPLKDKWILGLDPAYRTGCKLAVIDPLNAVQAISIIYPTPPNANITASKQELKRLLDTYPVEIIAIGNGTASRESEAFIAEFIAEYNNDIKYTIVSEAGASVYSASKIAKDEFPDLSVEQRSAISIARRVSDPLSELIKIDPRSIGVGQYQHDLPQKQLVNRLNFVVEKAVNRVGVNINQASVELLKHISGLSQSAAQSIVNYRLNNGKIKNRKEIKKIDKIGPKTYTQAIGFLRILDSDEVLDSTSIHPESYVATKQLLAEINCSDLKDRNQLLLLKSIDVIKVAQKLNIDEYTLKDIIDALLNGHRDYREQFDAPLLKLSIVGINDLKVGMLLEGVVRNVVDFGSFVDIGLKNDALIHITKFNKRIQHPSQIVAVGDIIEVEVIDINLESAKVSLRYVKHI